MKGRVLVTGGTGFVGSSMVQHLSLDGDRHIVAAIRGSRAALPDKVSQVSVGSLSSTTDWSQALDGVDVVVHCAARVHVMSESSADPLAAYRQVNVDGTLALAHQAAAARVRRFVFLSSIKVNGEMTPKGRPFHAEDMPMPEDPYGISKREAEDGLRLLARESAMEVVIIRSPLVYGPGVKGNFNTMMGWVAKSVPLPLGSVRHNRRSLVALDNLVDLIRTCLDHPAAANEVFLVGDGEDLSTADLLRRLARAMHRPTWLIPVPIWMLKSAATVLGRRNMMQRLCGSLQVDLEKTHELLGWAPPVTVNQALAITAAHFLDSQSK